MEIGHMTTSFHDHYGSCIMRMRSRPVYLWGAAQTGIGMLHALRRISVNAVGFIDKRKNELSGSVRGLPVFFPGEVLTASAEVKPFIINTTTLHTDEIIAECRDAGLTQENDFISYEQLCPFDYIVIVSSVCNLRCISCPVGNRPYGMNAGFMRASDYEKVLDKILAESPLLTMIQLFNWGEPFLNPELARIVGVTNERNVLCSLSSNMNLSREFEDVIVAKPAFLRISMSGNEHSYGITHAGGKWDLLMKNLRKLHELKDRYNPDMTVEIAYHVYATTVAQDIVDTRSLCDSLGFVFRPHLAALLPLDNVKDYLDGKPLSDEARKVIDLLRIPIDEALSKAFHQRDMKCCFEHTLSIESDLSVKQCGLWTRPSGNTVADNYLDTPLETIQSVRSESDMCPLCKSIGLHRFCSIYTDSASDIEWRHGFATKRD
jgi:MoaA/NifB/PqqE/SkfB family radical SAM enzyme